MVTFRSSVFLLALISLSSASAFITPVQKYKLKNDNMIYEGSERSDGVHLFVNGRSPIVVSTEDVIPSTKDRLDGVRVGDTVLARTQISPLIACFVNAVFTDRTLSMFCNNEKVVVNNQTLAVRGYYQAATTAVLPAISSFQGYETQKVYSLSQGTEKFEAGSSVRILHLYSNGKAIIEPAYRKFLNRVLNESSETVDVSLLK